MGEIWYLHSVWVDLAPRELAVFHQERLVLLIPDTVYDLQNYNLVHSAVLFFGHNYHEKHLPLQVRRSYNGCLIVQEFVDLDATSAAVVWYVERHPLSPPELRGSVRPPPRCGKYRWRLRAIWLELISTGRTSAPSQASFSQKPSICPDCLVN